MPQKSRSELDEASEAPVQLYLETPILQIFKQRFPWLLLLMLFQSVSGWVVERFEGTTFFRRERSMRIAPGFSVFTGVCGRTAKPLAAGGLDSACARHHESSSAGVM